MMMSDRFVELRHQLHDHAEDYERLTRSHQASTLGTHGDETSGSIQRSRVDENDPLFMVQEQLNQQVRDSAFASIDVARFDLNRMSAAECTEREASRAGREACATRGCCACSAACL